MGAAEAAGGTELPAKPVPPKLNVAVGPVAPAVGADSMAGIPAVAAGITGAAAGAEVSGDAAGAELTGGGAAGAGVRPPKAGAGLAAGTDTGAEPKAKTAGTLPAAGASVPGFALVAPNPARLAAGLGASAALLSTGVELVAAVSAAGALLPNVNAGRGAEVAGGIDAG